MPIDNFDEFRSQPLSAEEVRELIRASQRGMFFPSAPGMSGTRGVSSSTQHLSFPAANQFFMQDTFIGKIVPRGPNNETDLEGSKYWVREVVDETTEILLNRRPRWRVVNETGTVPSARWVAATNLSEWSDSGADGESHALAFGGPYYCVVYMTKNIVDAPLFYFAWGGGGGGGAALAVVTNVYGGLTNHIAVRAVVYNDSSGTHEITGHDVDVLCYPPLDSRHYEAFVRPVLPAPPDQPPPVEPLNPDDNPIVIQQIGSMNYAMQTMLTFPVRSPGVYHSDGELVQEP